MRFLVLEKKTFKDLHLCAFNLPDQIQSLVTILTEFHTRNRPFKVNQNLIGVGVSGCVWGEGGVRRKCLLKISVNKRMQNKGPVFFTPVEQFEQLFLADHCPLKRKKNCRGPLDYNKYQTLPVSQKIFERLSSSSKC